MSLGTEQLKGSAIGPAKQPLPWTQAQRPGGNALDSTSRLKDEWAIPGVPSRSRASLLPFLQSSWSFGAKSRSYLTPAVTLISKEA